MEEIHLDSLEECFKKSPQLKAEDLSHLREWLGNQPHLPHITDRQLVPFLHSCYYNLEKAKKTIESHFTIRSNSPEFFSNRDPYALELQNVWNVFNIAILPNKDEDGNRIYISKIREPDASKYVFEDTVKLNLMLLESVVHEEPTVPGFIFILDMDGTSMGHIMKPSFGAFKKYLEYVQQGLTLRMKRVHVVNTSRLTDFAMKLTKPFLSKELTDLLQFHHGNIENFHRYVSKSLLPEDYGGDLPPMDVIRKDCKKKIESLQSWFLETEKLTVDESKRTD